MPRRVEHTHRPDCETCLIRQGEAGAGAFRLARQAARRIHTRPHVPGETPVADAACAASERAIAQVPVCWSN